MTEIVLKIEGLDALTKAIQELKATLSAAPESITVPTGETSSAISKVVEAFESEQKAQLAETPVSESQPIEESDVSVAETPKLKEATRTYYAKNEKGEAIKFEKGDMMPERPSDAGFTRISKGDYDAAHANDDGLNEPVSGGPVEAEAAPALEKGDSEQAPVAYDKIAFKNKVLAFSAGDPERERGKALMKQYSVTKLSLIPEEFFAPIIDFIDAAASHLADGKPENIPASKNAVLLKKIAELPTAAATESEEW